MIAFGALLGVAAAPFAAASAEENGLKVGTGRLHPFFELGTDFDSRVKVDEADPTQGVSGLVLHLKPGLDFENSSKQVAFTLSATGDANLYPGLIHRGNRNLSYFGGDVDLSLDINRQGAVGLVLEDRFAHSDRNAVVAIEQGTRSLSNELGAKLPIRPGGGALEIVPAFVFQSENFLSVLGVTAPDWNYFSLRPGLQAKWRFLPKTAVIIDLQSDKRVYASGSGGPNIWNIYAKAGLSGLVTPKLSVVLNAGYGRSFLSSRNYSNVIGQAELAFSPNTFTRLKVGYARTYTPVPESEWFNNNRLYAGGSALLGGRLLFEFSGSYDLVLYQGGATRSDNVIGLDLGIRGRVTEWLDLGGGYRLDYRISTQATAGYMRHVVGILANFHY